MNSTRKKSADVTLVYSKKRISEIQSDFRCILDIDSNNKVTNIKTSAINENEYNLTTGAVLLKKDLLMKLVKIAVSENKKHFIKDVLQRYFSKMDFYAYEATGYCEFITSIKKYYDVNMQLFDKDIRNEIFDPKRPIYTKIRDDSPSKYGLNSSVKGSLIAQGCIIEGTVENSIISKGVYIGKNAKVSNCIIMQDTTINDDCNLSYIVVDKDVVINKGNDISGSKTYPMYIAKRSVV